MAVRYSDWIWSPEHKRHYCGVYDEDNNLIEYQWEGDLRQPVSSTSATTSRSQPRSTPSHGTENQQSLSRYYQGSNAQTATASSSAGYTTSPYQSSSPQSPAAQPYQTQYTSTVAGQSPYTQSPYQQQTPAQSHTSSGQYTYGTQSPNTSYDYTATVSQWGSRSQTQADPSSEEARLQLAVQEKVSNKQQRVVRTNNDSRDHEGLDPSYRRVAAHSHASFFVRGRVFKMLWTEPAGQAKTAGGTRGSTHFSLTYLGENAYSEIRRFVVIRNKETFSQCIPIQTYRGKGATKSGLIPGDHAIIYTGYTAPAPLRGEGSAMTKRPIRIDPLRGEMLDDASRVNFGKPYAVEHNVKLVEIGMVIPQHMHLLENYFKQAMGL